MLVRHGEARSGGMDRRLAVSLAAIAGTPSATGFYDAGFDGMVLQAMAGLQ